MVSIFTGLGSGFERGSSAALGGAGLLGSGTLGRSGEQVSLNAATGNLLISQRDEFLVGFGTDASVARTYNSLGDASDENGDNWRQSTDRRIYGLTGTANTSGSTVQRVSADGSEVTYSWNGTTYVATDGSGAHDKLTYDGAAWTWTDGDSQVTERYANVYNGQWRITAALNQFSYGYGLSYTYNGAQLDKVTTSNGEYVQYGWSGNNITQIVTGFTDLATNTAKTLTRTRYGYDGANRLTSVTVDLSPEDNAIGDGKTYVTSYTYDGSSKRVASISQTDGSRLDLGYDQSGRVTRLTQTTLGAPRITDIAYNAGYTTVTDSFNQATRFDYNVDGSLAKVTAPPAYAGAAAQVSQFGYDGAGNVTSVTDALGAVTTFTYDGSGNVLTTTDPLGNVVTRTYDALNNVLTETRTGSDADGAAVSHTTRYAYNDWNSLAFSVSAEGTVTRYFYDVGGKLWVTRRFTEQRYDVSALSSSTAIALSDLWSWDTSIADRSTIMLTSNVYDSRGNMVTTRGRGSATSTGVSINGDYAETTYVYDQAGQLLSRTTNGLNTERFVYDGLGRVIASTDLNGATTSIVFDDAASRTVVTAANGYVQTSTYSVSGELLSSTDTGADVNSGTAYYGYDREGQLRTSQDATGHVAYSVYDTVGRKVADVDHYGALTEYRYDSDDRVIATIRYATLVTTAQISRLQNMSDNVDLASIRPGSNTGDLVTRTVYDADGRVVEAISGDGSVTEYRYDGSSRLVATIVYANRLTAAQLAALDAAPATAVLPTADGSRDSIARNFYDKDGRLVGVLDGEGYLARTVYDAAGRAVAQTAFATATATSLRAAGTFTQLLASAGTNSADRTTRSVYDGQGLLRFSIDAQGNVSEFVYKGAADASANGVVRQTIQYAAPIGALAKYTVAALQTALAGQVGAAANRTGFSVYDTANRPAFTIDASGAVTGFAYDADGRLIKTTQFTSVRATTSLPDLATMAAWQSANTSGTDRITRNYYTARDELRFTVDAEGYVSRFDYDAEGRVVGTVRWDSAITVTDSTTITGVASLATGAAVATATAYDNDGRVSSSTDALNVVTAWSYNTNGTLASVTQAYGTADAVQTRYAYDAAGRKVSETAAYGTAEQRVTSWTYDGLGNVVSTTDADGNTTTFTYDRDGRQLTSTDALSGVTTYQYDAFGAVAKTTDPRGNASYAYYDTLGRVTATRDAEDFVTETSYTTFGEIASVARRANRATNSASVLSLPIYTADAAKDATTSFSYDRLGRVLSTTDALGFVESYTLNAFGQRLTITGKLGGVTTNAYDRRGLLTSETLPISSVSQTGAVQATTVTNRFEYDARGNRTKMTEASGLSEQRITSYVYDKLDRLIETRLPVVANAAGTGSVSPVTYAVYDARGNVIESRDAAGARTLFYYDKLDRQIASIGATGSYSTTAYTIVAGTGGVQTNRTYTTQLTLPTTAGGTPPTAPSGEYRETVATYDKLGRLATSAMTNVRTGSWNGSSYTTSIGTVTASWQYDADGNVVKTLDATGAATFSYYDKLGRKTASVDQAGYLTSWTLDGEGNALSERRYATAASGVTTSAPPTVATAATDRVTNFTYDRSGHRLTEQRTGLDYYTINANSGALTLVSGGSATVTYTYNALGQVLSKIEATGEAIGYSYDSAGRLSVESRTAYLDQTGASVTPTVRYFYDGLGNLTRSQQGGASASSSDRATSYTYGAGGRLTAMTDAAGQVRTYYYDVVGRKLGEAYVRVKADGSTVLNEGLSYQYDAVGNLTRQAFATVSGGTFTDAGDVTTLTYNAYGDVVARGLNGIQQESSAYDSAGRLWRSTSGDGVWRYYVYDANGKQTLALEDAGIGGALANQSLANVLAIATNNGANTVGAAYVAGINATITRYDARGQAISAIQTKRQLSATGTPVDLISQRSYNAFGETVSESDALSNVTTTSYNATGKAVSVQRAAVSVGNADGTVTTGVTPTDILFYDVSGRLIGQQDANGNRTSRLLLGGTGYGQATALVLREFHPDGGVKQGGYDVFGDLRQETDEIGRVASNVYDALGRLTQVTHAGGLVDYYGYDTLGQRTRHTNSALGGGNAETTDYDVQGRVVASRAFGGDVTTQSYSWNGTIATTGLGTFGGYQQITTFANGKTITESSDAFGHVTAHIDMGDNGGRTFYYRYDSGGRLLAREGAAATQRYTYLNTGLAAGVSTGIGLDPYYYQSATAAYSYDKLGRKLTEYATTGGQVTQNATATYDALGRMATWSEAGNATAPAASVTWSYDAVGNIRNQTQAFSYLAGNGAVQSTGSASWWYRYDTMNHVTTDRGTLSGGVIVRGARGVDLTYDAAGQRKTALSDRVLTGIASVFVFYESNGQYQFEQPIEPGITGDYQDQPRDYNGQTRETYLYNADGTLAATVIDETSYTDNGDGTISANVGSFDRAGGGGVYTYDGLGRQTRQIDTNDVGTVLYDHQLGYDAKGRVISDQTSQIQGNDTVVTSTTTSYGDGTSAYALGAALSSDTSGYRLVNNYTYQAIPTSHTATSYDWYDGAVQSRVDYTPNTAQGATNYTTYVNSGVGVLQSANVVDGRTRTVTVTSDALGQVIRRDEEDGNAWNPTTYTGGDPHEVWYRFNGKQIGSTGNNSTYDTTYAGSLADRTHTVWGGNGAFRYGGTLGQSYAEFNDQLTPINTYSQGSSGGSYTVRQGDTLASVAAQLWGDASLWYKLAGANGLSGGSALTTGQTLSVPAGVSKNADSASTFKPYNPSDAYGDTSPTTPKPQAPKKNKCGVFGAILLVIIAVAVAAIAGPALIGTVATTAGVGGATTTAVATGLTATLGGLGATAGSAAAIGAGVIGGAIAGALGSVVSQGFGVATGLQDKFSWKGVALAAIGGGIGGGLGGANLFGTVGSKFVQGALRGATGNILNQGVGLATGLQSKFDFVGVATAGIGGGIGGALQAKFTAKGSSFNFGEKLITNAASGLANAATRTVLSGTDFGDNLLAALPDVIGGTIGGFLAEKVTAPGRLTAQAKAFAAKNAPQVLGDQDSFNKFRSDYKAAIGYIRARDAGDSSGATGSNLTKSLARLLEYVQQADATESNFAPSNNIANDTIVIQSDRILTSFVRQMNAATKESFTAWEEIQDAERVAYEEKNDGFTYSLISEKRGQALEYLIRAPLLSAGSFVYDNVPFVGTAKTIVQIGTGRDVFTGERVDRRFESASLLPSLIPGAKTALKIGEKAFVRAAESRAVSVLERTGCFVAGTQVHTRDGLRPIEDISVGDYVLSQPEGAGEHGYRKVIETFVYDDKSILQVTYQDASGRTESVEATYLHPFWVKGVGWQGAQYLMAGQIVELHDGREAYVVALADTGRNDRVHNFTVDGFHTYYVGELGVWVHNVGVCGAGAAKGIPGVLAGADRAIIDPRKLTEYALNPAHPVGGNKARVFESAFGFNANNADDLLGQIARGVRETPAIAGKVDKYGSRFTVDIPVVGPKGSGTVRTGWIYKNGSSIPELTTLFPK